VPSGFINLNQLLSLSKLLKNIIMKFSKLTFIWLASITLSHPLVANTDMRDWTFTKGDKKRAELLSVDEKAGTVVLRNEAGVETTVLLTALSGLDRAWVLEWTETEDEALANVAKLGGSLAHYQGKGATTTTDFYVYTPSATTAPEPLKPLIIMFDAGGKGKRFLLKHIEAAEAAGITTVACDVFKNNHDPLVEDMQERFAELLPIILKTVPHDPKRLFMGGNSGGAERAYHYSAYFNKIPWAGIYANGGWLGPPNFYDLPYGENMRVAIVNGDKDHANVCIEPTSIVLREHHATISIMSFEGGHQTPPPSVQAKAFKWLLGKIE
jgi:hypothetical protein